MTSPLESAGYRAVPDDDRIAIHVLPPGRFTDPKNIIATISYEASEDRWTVSGIRDTGLRLSEAVFQVTGAAIPGWYDELPPLHAAALLSDAVKAPPESRLTAD